MLSLSSCASLATPLLPLPKRSLYIDADKGVFYSTYTVCKSKYVVFKTCKLERIEYDFGDLETRKKLKNIGFKLKVVR